MESRDLRIDIYTNSSPNIRMTITHVPTGLSVNGSGIREYKLKKRLISELENKLHHP